MKHDERFHDVKSLLHNNNKKRQLTKANSSHNKRRSSILNTVSCYKTVGAIKM